MSSNTSLPGKGLLWVILAFLLLVLPGLAQDSDDVVVDLDFDGGSIAKFCEVLSKASERKVFYSPELEGVTLPSCSYNSTRIDSIDVDYLRLHSLSFMMHRNRLIIILPMSEIQRHFTAQYYQALEESIVAEKNTDQQEIVVGHVEHIDQSGEIILKGVVRDAETHEEIIGATVVVESLGDGSVTDLKGEFTMPLTAGSHVLVIQYVGYQMKRIPIKVISSATLELVLEKTTVLLDEVVVQAQGRDENVRGVQVGVTRVSTKEIEKLPSFLGEVDIIKGLLMQPGISTIGEGASGFNVRGGNVDQNLILIDEGMIFNANHALGFFSSFNPDIVSEAVLYKGAMPSSYAGRLASVLDVKMRDGSFDRWHLKGGLGPISSRVTLDGPIKEDKSSVLMSFRSTYSDWILDQVNIPEVQKSSAFFYDANLRMTHRFDDRNNLTFSSYLSSDDFSFNEAFGFNYSTALAQLQYRKILGQKTLSTTNVIYSKYSSAQDDLDSVNASRYNTGLEYLKVKANISYLGKDFESDVGVSGIYYNVSGNEVMPMGDISLVDPLHLDDQQALEWGLYGDFDWSISPRISLVGGVHFSVFQFLGPFKTYEYADAERPSSNEILRPITIDDPVVESYEHIQPRMSFRYNLTSNSSVKMGYGRTVQYINQIYNSETPTPTNFWQLSHKYIPPQTAHNFSVGYFQNFQDNLWISSFDVFYRKIDQLYDYVGFADLIANDHLETELLTGVGRAYGLEVSVQRQVGVVHGWINYTYSRTERKIEGINEHTWYPSNFDKPHDLNLVTSLQINKRNSISMNFTYSTGRPITVPVNRFVVFDRFSVLNYSKRNAFRIPNYHRLDLSYNLAQGFRKSKKFKTSWTFSIYNIYGRKNPYSVFVEQEGIGVSSIRKLSILGTAFPSLTFNFELL